MAKAPQRTKHVAVLDDDGKLIDYAEVNEDADGIEVPERDLDPGRYRWDGKTFHPIQSKQMDPLGVTIGALAAALVAIRDADVVPLPQETLDFLKIWEKSGELGK